MCFSNNRCNNKMILTWLCQFFQLDYYRLVKNKSFCVCVCNSSKACSFLNEMSCLLDCKFNLGWSQKPLRISTSTLSLSLNWAQPKQVLENNHFTLLRNENPKAEVPMLWLITKIHFIIFHGCRWCNWLFLCNLHFS